MPKVSIKVPAVEEEEPKTLGQSVHVVLLTSYEKNSVRKKIAEILYLRVDSIFRITKLNIIFDTFLQYIKYPLVF